MEGNGPWLVVEGPGGAVVLRPGRVVKGRVVGRAGRGRIRVRVGGAELEAASLLPLAPGQELTLKVESIYPRVLLKVVHPHDAGIHHTLAKALAALVHAGPRMGRLIDTALALEPVGWPAQAMAALERLKSWLARARVDGPQRLEVAVEALGLGLEAALAKARVVQGARAELARILLLAPPGPELEVLRSLAGLLKAVAVACGGLRRLGGEGLVLLGMMGGGVVEMWIGNQGRVEVWMAGEDAPGLRLNMELSPGKVQLEAVSESAHHAHRLRSALPGLARAIEALGRELKAEVVHAQPVRVVQDLLSRYRVELSLKV